jgi:hypothetical protein
MRLWTLHPKYLDAQGLVALWRESLLAQAVLAGRTRGYRAHPQLERFREHRSPAGSIAAYLRTVHAEACARGYAFDAKKIGRPMAGAGAAARMTATRGQLEHEWRHLLAKLERRDPERWSVLVRVRRPQPNPLFTLRAGAVASWERAPGRVPSSPRRPGARSGSSRRQAR